METITATRTYSVDRSHSQVGFKVRHLGFSKVAGRFTDFDATVELEPGSLETLSAKATIQVASLTTNEEARDTHLRSDDFFKADAFPQMVFESTAVRAVRGSELKLDGNLTIRDVTRPVTLNVTYMGDARDPWGGQRIAFEAVTKINRKDFGLTWNVVLETGGLLVGEDVEIVLEIEAVQNPE